MLRSLVRNDEGSFWGNYLSVRGCMRSLCSSKRRKGVKMRLVEAAMDFYGISAKKWRGEWAAKDVGRLRRSSNLV